MSEAMELNPAALEAAIQAGSTNPYVGRVPGLIKNAIRAYLVVAQPYRAGAEAMREAAQASLKARVQHWRKTAASAPTDGKRRQAMRISEETDECIDAIRALPMPGDEG